MRSTIIKDASECIYTFAIFVVFSVYLSISFSGVSVAVCACVSFSLSRFWLVSTELRSNYNDIYTKNIQTYSLAYFRNINTGIKEMKRDEWWKDRHIHNCMHIAHTQRERHECIEELVSLWQQSSKLSVKCALSNIHWFLKELLVKCIRCCMLWNIVHTILHLWHFVGMQ